MLGKEQSKPKEMKKEKKQTRNNGIENKYILERLKTKQKISP